MTILFYLFWFFKQFYFFSSGSLQVGDGFLVLSAAPKTEIICIWRFEYT